MRSTLASNTSSFNGCLRLTIVTKLIIKSVHFKNINPGEVGGGGVLSYIDLIDIALKK